MGKVRKIRQKYHLSLKKSKSLNNLLEAEEKNEVEVKDNLFKSSENIFAGVDISWDAITKSLPKEFDVRSIASTKSRKELKEEERHLPKKEKQKLRHQRFMRKLDIAQQLKKDFIKKKKKKKPKDDSNTCMQALLDALPSLKSLEKDSCKNNFTKPKTKLRGILKAKQRLKQQSNDSKLFKKILEDKTFKANPLEAISQFLKQKVATQI